MFDFARLEIGRRFADRYLVERLLKVGGMGGVYVAQHVHTHERVALKVMRPEIVGDPSARARFEQEARASALVGSAGVVKIIDAGVDGATNLPFLVMELLRGNDLGEVVRERGRLAPDDVVRYVTQTARALDRAHAAGMVHRDLKPENLFLAEQEDDEPPRVKILDFGIAKFTLDAKSKSTQGAGTPLYMAPEQTRRSADIGPHTDVWALGLIAYTLLVGAPYWEAQDLHQLYGEILGESHEKPTARAARRGVTLPTGFDAWFFRCVDRNPHARFAKAGEAAAALGAVFGVRHVSAPPPDPLAATEPVAVAAGTLALAETEAVARVDALAETEALAIGTSRHAVEPEADRAVPDDESASGGATKLTGTPVASGARRRVAKLAIGVAALTVAGLAAYKGMHFTMRSTPGALTTGASTPAASAGQSDELSTPPPAARPTAMARIPGGDYEAGEPRKHVAVAPFYLDVNEVTVGAYEQCVSSGKCTAANADHPACNRGKPDRLLHPINCVDFTQAEAFCAAYGKRLPTAEEWEWAARGGPKASTYPWGEDPPARQVCWNGEGNDLGLSRRQGTCSIGTYLKGSNAWEIHDLAGNVWEWTTTTFEGGTKRIVCGGSWHSVEPSRLSVSSRFHREPDERDILLGFRCALSM